MSATVLTAATPDMPAARDAPVAADDRYDSLDLLRGIAVLMIFAVNIRSMLQPFFAQADPRVWTGPHDLAIDRVLQFAVDGKWVATFSVLFGAGLMLLHEKAVAVGAKPSDRIVRRQMWLIGFGLVHAILIWLGDILLTYGVVGLMVMPLLGRRSRTVAVWAAGVIAVGVGLLWLLSLMVPFMLEDPSAAEAMSMSAFIAGEVEAKSGGIGAQLAWRATQAPLVVGNVVIAPVFVLPYMLIGVLAFRSGFLLARWPAWRYALIGAVCLGGAWAMDWWRIGQMGVWDGAAPKGPYEVLILQYLWFGVVEGLAGAIGYAALVMAAARPGLRVPPLSAAGRMAFTNYVACSVIGTTLAAGHGAGLLGELTLAQAMVVVGATWIAMLVWSPLWLRAFRYGPLEWAWRSLSYGRMQPMRR